MAAILFQPQCVNTLEARTKFHNIFQALWNALFWRVLHFYLNLTKVCLRGSNWQQVSIGSGDGLGPNRWQSITWTNVDPIHLCIYSSLGLNLLTHWGWMTHICVSKIIIIGSDNGLSPGWHKAIIWTNAVILLIWTLGTNFSEIFSKIHTFSFKKMHLKMLS